MISLSAVSKTYLQTIIDLLAEIERQEEAGIDRAAGILAKAVQDDKLINVIGPGGHSNMAVEEVFWRAGSLAPINGLLDAGTNLIHGAKRSNVIERTLGYAKSVLDSYRLVKGDVLVIANSNGINSMTIDCALECKERGITSIGVTSKGFALTVPKGAPSRHPSGKNLFECVDVFIDTHMPSGDACVQVEGVPQKMGAISTFLNSFVMNLLQMRTAERLVAMGIDPPVWMSANLPEGDAANQRNMERYAPRIKHLL